MLQTAEQGEGRSSNSPLRRDIQGLRAIAVVSVVLHHANNSLVPSGFAGVDIFFVISGYLIAGILMGEISRGHFSLAGFYERRARRLFPALFAMLSVVIVVGGLTLSPHAFRELGETAVATIFFVSNFVFFQLSGYFDGDSHFRPLLHTWSLAVEEQFYLLFPLALFAATKLWSRHVRLLMVLAGIASFAACLWALPKNAAAAFYLAPFRGYELLIGAALARLPFPLRAPGWLRDALSLVGLVATLAGVLVFTATTPFPGAAALLPCGGAALLLFTGAGGETLGGRLISGPVFGFFGALSYSLYLWHWPVLVLGESILLRAPEAIETAVLLAISLALAVLSWRFIERPFIRGPSPRKRTLAIAGAAMGLGACVAGSIVLLDGMPGRFGAPALAMFEQSENFSPRRADCHNFMNELVRYEDHCVLGAAGVASRMAVWADSFGVELAAALAERLAPRDGALLQITSSACPPALDYADPFQRLCAAQNALTLEALRDDTRIDTVVIVANYSAYPSADWPEIAAGLGGAVEGLAAAGKRVILIDPIPVFSYDVPSALGLVTAHGGDANGFTTPRAAFERDNRRVLAALAGIRTRAHALSVRPADVLCDAVVCRAFAPGKGALYFNRDHLSMAGARLLAERVPLAPVVHHASVSPARTPPRSSGTVPASALR